MTDNGKLKEVFKRAGTDLENAELPGLVNWAFAPLRDLVLVPTVNTASKVLPTIPVIDDVSAFLLDTTFNMARFGYSVLPTAKEDGFKHEVQDEAVSETTPFMEKRGKREARSGIISSLKGAFGFGINTTLDFFTDPGQKVSDWTASSLQLLGFLMYTGIGSQLTEAFLRPGASFDIRIMGIVQGQMKASRREATGVADEITDFPFRDAMWYMRYATAAYGVSMMESAERLITVNPFPQWSIFDFIERTVNNATTFVLGSWDKTNKAKICRYVNIKPHDIKYITPLYVGGSTKILRHFVAVDTKKKAVVLAIRGTYTVSGIVTDLDGTTIPFCGGFAHKGISEMATAILENNETMSAIQSAFALPAYRDYELIITGHSLGAGTACLVNIKGSFDNLFPPGIKVRCFAFASPPVYASQDNSLHVANGRVLEAIRNTTCYIHEDDCVPFLSADAVVRLASVLNRLHNKADSSLNAFNRWRMAAGKIDPTPEIVQAVENGAQSITDSRRNPIGSRRLYVPAETVLWMYKSNSDPNGFAFQYSSPVEIADLNILLSPKMIADHMPAQYEKALYAVF